MSSNKQPTNSNNRFSTIPLTLGAIIGFIVGAVYGLLKLPRTGSSLMDDISGRSRDLVNQLQPEDPIAQSLAEGKDAARQRQSTQ